MWMSWQGGKRVVTIWSIRCKSLIETLADRRLVSLRLKLVFWWRLLLDGVVGRRRLAVTLSDIGVDRVVNVETVQIDGRFS